jgi:hypothetical protein
LLVLAAGVAEVAAVAEQADRAAALRPVLALVVQQAEAAPPVRALLEQPNRAQPVVPIIRPSPTAALVTRHLPLCLARKAALIVTAMAQPTAWKTIRLADGVSRIGPGGAQCTAWSSF